jgi:hypothetical protein
MLCNSVRDVPSYNIDCPRSVVEVNVTFSVLDILMHTTECRMHSLARFVNPIMNQVSAILPYGFSLALKSRI